MEVSTTENEVFYTDSDSSTQTMPALSPPKVLPTQGKDKVGRNVKVLTRKRKFELSTPSKCIFVTHYADKVEPHRSKFQLLPVIRRNEAGSIDKLAQRIQAGGGIVVSNSKALGDKNSVIKILDLDFVRENIHKDVVKEMVIPYDCFSSSFIWSQIYHHKNGMKADLNLYRVSSSTYESYDANQILAGSMGWNEIETLPLEKRPPSMQIKHVALQLFPELMLTVNRRIYSRQDSQLLLDKVCESGLHDQVLGKRMYKELAQHFPDRTWSSLREHFRRTILPHIIENDGYYVLGDGDVEKFLKGHTRREELLEAKTQKLKKKRAEEQIEKL